MSYNRLVAAAPDLSASFLNSRKRHDPAWRLGPYRSGGAYAGSSAVSVPKCTLLVVDDEHYILTTLAHLLGADFSVLTADSADAAKELFARQPIDIILSDQKMPRTTGVQLLEWVRENHPNTVRLLMTGFVELEDAIAAINRGHVYHYLLKPWRAEELRQVLRHAAEKFTLERNREDLLEQLRQLNRDLEKRVTERTRELQEANHLLQQRTRELERLALTDPLTGLFNRRATEELARFELKRHARYPSPLTLGYIDVDHFKQVNTDYLLTGGDEVLAAFGPHPGGRPARGGFGRPDRRRGVSGHRPRDQRGRRPYSGGTHPLHGGTDAH